MRKRLSITLLVLLFSFILLIPLQAEAKRTVKAKAYASKIDEISMAWCPHCGWEKCSLNISLIDLYECPKCGNELKSEGTQTSTINGYGEVAYKATVKKNKTTVITFPSKPRPKIKGGYVLSGKRIKRISRLFRYKGPGSFKIYGKNKIKVKCKKKTKIMILFQGHAKTLLTINVKK